MSNDKYRYRNKYRYQWYRWKSTWYRHEIDIHGIAHHYCGDTSAYFLPVYIIEFTALYLKRAYNFSHQHWRRRHVVLVLVYTMVLISVFYICFVHFQLWSLQQKWRKKRFQVVSGEPIFLCFALCLYAGTNVCTYSFMIHLNEHAHKLINPSGPEIWLSQSNQSWGLFPLLWQWGQD